MTSLQSGAVDSNLTGKNITLLSTDYVAFKSMIRENHQPLLWWGQGLGYSSKIMCQNLSSSLILPLLGVLMCLG